jgi:serralysin
LRGIEFVTGSTPEQQPHWNNAFNLLRGNAGNDTLNGGIGDDTMADGAGADSLVAGDGNDLLRGEAGQDPMEGGLGADTFDFNAISDSAVGATANVITGFSQTDADRIDLFDLDANSLLTGNQAFTFIGAGAFTGSPGQLGNTASGTSTDILADVNGDSIADLQIKLSTTVSLSATDFVL